MTQQETKAVEDAVKKLNWLEANAFIKGAQFLDELRKPIEPETNVGEAVEELVSEIKAAIIERSFFNACNVSRIEDCEYKHIEKNMWFLPEEYFESASNAIAALMQPDKELLEVLKRICRVAPSYIKNPDDELDNAICEAMLTVYNYEQKQSK